MPKLNGQEVAVEINKLNSKTPIILMSGYSENEVNGRFEKVIIARALQKPVGFAQLLEAVTAAINGNDQAKAA